MLNGTANGLVGNDPMMRQSPGTANALASKMYEESLKLPIQKDSLDEASMKVCNRMNVLISQCVYAKMINFQQRFGDNMGQLLDPSNASMLKQNPAAGQSTG